MDTRALGKQTWSMGLGSWSLEKTSCTKSCVDTWTLEKSPKRLEVGTGTMEKIIKGLL
jgi:hypothetical protein